MDKDPSGMQAYCIFFFAQGNAWPVFKHQYKLESIKKVPLIQRKIRYTLLVFFSDTTKDELHNIKRHKKILAY